MHKNWERVARILERENQRLEGETRQLRRSRDEVLAEARRVLGVAILPDVEIEHLPGDQSDPQQQDGIGQTEMDLFFPDDEHRQRCEQRERELKVLEPAMEQLRYWGDIRDPGDRQVRAVAIDALDRLAALRALPETADSPSSTPAVDFSAGVADPLANW